MAESSRDVIQCFGAQEKLPLLHNPMALLREPPLCFMSSPAAKHLMKDNLFRCLMLWHWLVEDYVRWLGDLWRLAEAWRMCGSACEAKCGCYAACTCVSLCQGFSGGCMWVCVIYVCTVPRPRFHIELSCLPACLCSELLHLWQQLLSASGKTSFFMFTLFSLHNCFHPAERLLLFEFYYFEMVLKSLPSPHCMSQRPRESVTCPVNLHTLQTGAKCYCELFQISLTNTDTHKKWLRSWDMLLWLTPAEKTVAFYKGFYLFPCICII